MRAWSGQMIVVKSDDLEIALSRRRPDEDLIIIARDDDDFDLFSFQERKHEEAFDKWVSKYFTQPDEDPTP